MLIFENELIFFVKFFFFLKGYCFGGMNVFCENLGNKMRLFILFSFFVI